MDNQKSKLLELIDIETEPEVIITDRAHHIFHLAEMIYEESLDTTSYDYVYEIFKSRRYKYLSSSNQLKRLQDISISVEFLLSLPWFKKLIKVLVESSFVGKYQLYNKKELPTWDNINVFLVDILAYIVTEVWPEHRDLLLSRKGYFDEICLYQLNEFKTNLDNVDTFIQDNKSRIRSLPFNVTNLLTTTLLDIIDNPGFRDLITVLYTSPQFIQESIQKYIGFYNNELSYERDIGTESELNKDSFAFQSYIAIVNILKSAYLDNPKSFVEFTCSPGAICLTAGKADSDFGRHCSKHYNQEGDYIYLLCIEQLAKTDPTLQQQIILNYNEKGKLTSILVPLSLVGDYNFILQIKSLRESLS